MRYTCQNACPANVEVPVYLDLARQKRYEEAYRVIQSENPLVLTCGRVCNHPCEGLCNRARIDEPIAINGVKRFITDVLLERDGKLPVPEVAKANGKKVAVVGSGPSGLSCAFYLQKKGYGVTVFEEAPIVGGMLVLGLPPYRLPRDKFEKELDVYRAMGIKFQTNAKLGRDFSVPDLIDRGFLKIYIAPGARCEMTVMKSVEGCQDVEMDPARTVKELKASVISGYRWEFGSLAAGPDSVVGAVGRGKQGASNIDRALGGDGQVATILKVDRVVSGPPHEEPCGRFFSGWHAKKAAEEEVIREASRCLRCDVLKVQRL
jgi:NADPH-dependent glutamate synthase beta subunit-like oxidoreductase